ncbi:hypothetical protein [Croceivirga radicis]|uniref:hypothetical protein n=1 Tax=Croceivirga radicis TaxID=1929488 RepID=UPI000255AFC7|nr:hypothetical protein [Croceivirga radicis]
MKFLEKHIKFWTFYLALIYGIGFLILSTRLSFLGIYIKDFLTLDYLKAGILFFFVNLPLIYIIYRMNKDLKNKKKLKFIIQYIGCFMWLIFLQAIVFQSNNEWNILRIIVTFIIYLGIVFLFVNNSFINTLKNKENDIMENGLQIVLSIVLITAFANTIYPQIQFRYGGGAPYNKVLYIEQRNKIIKEVNAKVYYENEKWLHYLSENKMISIPKNSIVREQNTLEDDFILRISE